MFGNLVNRVVRSPRRHSAAACRTRERRRARARAVSRDWRARRAAADASRSVGVPAGCRGDARNLGARQRLCAGDGAVDRDQFRSRARRGRHAHRAEPGPAVRRAGLEHRADARRQGPVRAGRGRAGPALARASRKRSRARSPCGAADRTDRTAGGQARRCGCRTPVSALRGLTGVRRRASVRQAHPGQLLKRLAICGALDSDQEQ